jgi:hypothetical protein
LTQIGVFATVNSAPDLKRFVLFDNVFIVSKGINLQILNDQRCIAQVQDFTQFLAQRHAMD